MDIKTWKSDTVTIRVDYDNCQGHRDCADACPSEVYELTDGKTVPVNIEERQYTGYWNQIQSYISKHSGADFSHDICPECTDKI